MLTPITVGGLKQSLKCVMRWGPHHQCPGYVVVSVTRASIPASNPSEYFRRTIIVSSLDHLLSELDKAFSSHKKKLIFKVYTLYHQCWQVSSEVMKVGELYAVDLTNVSSLSGEIHNWYTKWKSEEKDHGKFILEVCIGGFALWKLLLIIR